MAAPGRDEIVFLARHSTPAVDTAVPPEEWPLSAEGVAGAERLANRLVGAEIDVDIVVSSTERKARDTAIVVADRLGVQFQTGHDLHEHRRAWEEDDEVFRRSRQELFRTPPRDVCDRFDKALRDLHSAHRGQRLFVVTHGTVLSLHLARHYRVDGWTTWQRLGMPSYVALDRKTKAVLDLATGF